MAQYHNNSYAAYRLYKEANLSEMAHTIAMDHLAHDVILRDDMRLLKEIFGGFDPSQVDGWSFRGKVGYFCFFFVCIRADVAVKAVPGLCGLYHDLPQVDQLCARCCTRRDRGGGT